MSAFTQALLAAERPFIMEIKRHDGHGNDLLGGRSIAEVVATYTEVGAPCLSVVTGHWFGGTVEMLREVAQRSNLPLLQKDFLTRRDQLVAARDLGVSAVLLTAKLLPRTTLHSLVGIALSLGLTPFVEVTEEKEVAGLPDAEECVIAVNNKDIRAKEKDPADLERSIRLLPALLSSGTRCPVSASGIGNPRDAARLVNAGFAGLLIGTSLLQTENLPGWLADFAAAVTRKTVPARLD